MKAFENYNSNVAQKMKFACDRVENIVGNGENSGYN